MEARRNSVIRLRSSITFVQQCIARMSILLVCMPIPVVMSRVLRVIGRRDIIGRTLVVAMRSSVHLTHPFHMLPLELFFRWLHVRLARKVSWHKELLILVLRRFEILRKLWWY